MTWNRYRFVSRHRFQHMDETNQRTAVVSNQVLGTKVWHLLEAERSTVAAALQWLLLFGTNMKWLYVSLLYLANADVDLFHIGIFKSLLLSNYLIYLHQDGEPTAETQNKQITKSPWGSNHAVVWFAPSQIVRRLISNHVEVIWRDWGYLPR